MAEFVKDDPQWSDGTRSALGLAETRLSSLVEATRDEGDPEAAELVAMVGGGLLALGAALCSALADVAATVRGRAA